MKRKFKGIDIDNIVHGIFYHYLILPIDYWMSWY